MKRVLSPLVLSVLTVGSAIAHPRLVKIPVGVDSRFVTADAITRAYDMETRGNPKTQMTAVYFPKGRPKPIRPAVLSVTPVACSNLDHAKSCLRVNVLGRTRSSDTGIEITEIYHFTYMRSNGVLVEQGGTFADDATALSHGFPTNDKILNGGQQ